MQNHHLTEQKNTAISHAFNQHLLGLASRRIQMPDTAPSELSLAHNNNYSEFTSFLPFPTAILSSYSA